MASKTRWLSKLKRSYHGVHAKYFNNLSTSFLVATDHDRLNETNAALTLYERYGILNIRDANLQNHVFLGALNHPVLRFCRIF